MQTRLHPSRQQGGAALVIGLILLLILTVLGVSALGTATTEVRLAHHGLQTLFRGAASQKLASHTLNR